MSVAETKEFLRSRGCPEGVVAGGADGLIEEWERVVGLVETGYKLGLDDYLNDLDGRELIAALVAHITRALTPTQKRRLEAADMRMRAAVKPLGRCLWGDRLAAANGWDATRNWWYFSRPAKPGPDLAQELGGGKS